MGGEESSPISRLLRNSGAPSALKQIVHKSSSLYTLFHSVFYNSVVYTVSKDTKNLYYMYNMYGINQTGN